MAAIDRRRFLSSVARAAVASAAFEAIPSWARAAVARAGASARVDLLVRNTWPEHLETTVEALGDAWLTGNERFFVRSHFPPPTIDAARWRLEIAGLVRRPITVALSDLGAAPQAEVAHVLECAGNGRGLFRLPNTSGTQWEYGAVGNARWGGVRLRDLLDRAEPLPEAKHVWFEAADHASLPTVPPFLRSIPIAKAMDDTLLATRMNGAPLPDAHGAPCRAIVPGWYGMASAKWITKIRLEAAPSDNHFMVKGYRYTYPGEDPAQAPPVEEIRVKSLITRPLQGARVARGRLKMQGWAWAGSKGLRSVEVSADGGRSWVLAELVGEESPMAWRGWSADLEANARGPLRIMARATDGAGETQPLEARANAGGYGNNTVHGVTVHVG